MRSKVLEILTPTGTWTLRQSSAGYTVYQPDGVERARYGFAVDLAVAVVKFLERQDRLETELAARKGGSHDSEPTAVATATRSSAGGQ